MMRSAVLTQSTRVTDRQTDGQAELAWHILAIAYMLSRVKSLEYKNAVQSTNIVCPFSAAARNNRSELEVGEVNDVRLVT